MIDRNDISDGRNRYEWQLILVTQFKEYITRFNLELALTNLPHYQYAHHS